MVMLNELEGLTDDEPFQASFWLRTRFPFGSAAVQVGAGAGVDAAGHSDGVQRRPDRRHRPSRTGLGTDIDELLNPRTEGLRSALQVLLVARRALNSRRTADRNALNALVRTHHPGVDARKALTGAQVRTIASWRHRPTDFPATATIRDEAPRLATAVLTATGELEQNHTALERRVDELRPGLRKIHAVGPVTAATILTAWSHRGRVRSEAAFAALAGAAPLPASSDKTARHRLNRSGDRQLNMALDVIARVRTSRDPVTRPYVQRRTIEGRSPREIRRFLKRYIARHLPLNDNAIHPQAREV